MTLDDFINNFMTGVLPGWVKDGISMLGGGAVAAGYLTNDQLVQVGGVAAILVVALWTYIHRKWIQNNVPTPTPTPTPVANTTHK